MKKPKRSKGQLTRKQPGIRLDSKDIWKLLPPSALPDPKNTKQTAEVARILNGGRTISNASSTTANFNSNYNTHIAAPGAPNNDPIITEVAYEWENPERELILMDTFVDLGLADQDMYYNLVVQANRLTEALRLRTGVRYNEVRQFGLQVLEYLYAVQTGTTVQINTTIEELRDALEQGQTAGRSLLRISLRLMLSIVATTAGRSHALGMGLSALFTRLLQIGQVGGRTAINAGLQMGYTMAVRIQEGGQRMTALAQEQLAAANDARIAVGARFMDRMNEVYQFIQDAMERGNALGAEGTRRLAELRAAMMEALRTGSYSAFRLALDSLTSLLRMLQSAGFITLSSMTAFGKRVIDLLLEVMEKQRQAEEARLAEERSRVQRIEAQRAEVQAYMTRRPVGRRRLSPGAAMRFPTPSGIQTQAEFDEIQRTILGDGNQRAQEAEDQRRAAERRQQVWNNTLEGVRNGGMRALEIVGNGFQMAGRLIAGIPGAVREGVLLMEDIQGQEQPSRVPQAPVQVVQPSRVPPAPVQVVQPSRVPQAPVQVVQPSRVPQREPTPPVQLVVQREPPPVQPLQREPTPPAPIQNVQAALPVATIQLRQRNAPTIVNMRNAIYAQYPERFEGLGRNTTRRHNIARSILRETQPQLSGLLKGDPIRPGFM